MLFRSALSMLAAPISHARVGGVAGAYALRDAMAAQRYGLCPAVAVEQIKLIKGLPPTERRPTVRVARLSSSRQNNGDVRHGWWPASRSVHPCTGSLHHPGVNCLLGLDEGGKRIRGGGRGLCAERSETAAHIGRIQCAGDFTVKIGRAHV